MLRVHIKVEVQLLRHLHSLFPRPPLKRIKKPQFRKTPNPILPIKTQPHNQTLTIQLLSKHLLLPHLRFCEFFI